MRPKPKPENPDATCAGTVSEKSDDGLSCGPGDGPQPADQPMDPASKGGMEASVTVAKADIVPKDAGPLPECANSNIAMYFVATQLLGPLMFVRSQQALSDEQGIIFRHCPDGPVEVDRQCLARARRQAIAGGHFPGSV